ncbi:MAG: S-layer homology domain-containing protein [Firmicutes bacterium]|nr:S-layer homology domain-containing protein [Bacillota bacterium]
MYKKNNIKSVLSLILTICMMLTISHNVLAAQSNEYVDPADVWMSAAGRTNEFDMNATITYETAYCPVCNKDSIYMAYRVPEYTKSGQTALNRNVKYSDGTCFDGVTKGNLDSGTPGVDAYYTGYHFTKSVCQSCGTINAIDGPGAYDFNKNVYTLNSCDHSFFLDFDNTTYEPYNSTYHTTTLKKGQYCQFCKGTFARATEKREAHNFTEVVDAQLGNNRFYIHEHCDDCGYETSEYVTAKSVVSSYYGNADGEAHTLTVSDLSDRGVSTSIRYGKSADDCTLTSAPNFIEAGYNTVYYKITYTYDGESMTENGVSYVWLLEEPETNITIIIPETRGQTHEHDYRYVETVPPTCDTLGYERWQCAECGGLEKKNYVPMTGHNYETITVREASCTQGGLTLHICRDCGDFYTETTPIGSHHYHTKSINPTCQSVGYTEHTCDVCGDKYITDIQPLVSHAFERITKVPTCIDKGYTTSTCAVCGFSYVSDYTDATGHDWDEGHTVTNSTCEGEGVIEYHCKNCDEKMIKSTSANGHRPGMAATCTEPQICEDCGTILQLPKGHTYESRVIAPTCTAMGYTVYKCKDCDDTYTGDYTDKAPHHYHKTVTQPTCTSSGYTTYTCVNCCDEYVSDYTDKTPHNFKAVVTEPTCTEFGFTTYTCADCGESYVSDYTDKLPHNYSKQIVAPTCTEHGYTVYTCPDCGNEYIGNITDCEQHTYKETVIPPTCTEMGYSIFKCEACEDEYKGNYTDKLPHSYKAVVTNPTCTEFGFTTFTCENCGDSYVSDYTDRLEHDYTVAVTEPTCTEFGFSTYTCKDCGHSYIADHTDKLPHDYKAVVTNPTCTAMGFTTYTCKECQNSYVADYTDMTGHKLSDWIVDEAATIEHSGTKHIECTVCGEKLKDVEIPQLTDTDRTDEDGNAMVGKYAILLTDKNGIPVFNSEIIIDVNDNITIKLPKKRLIDYADQTTVTVVNTETNLGASDIRIFIFDSKNNAATGVTDENGQVKFPNNQSSTGDDNGTIGKDNEEAKETYVVRVTDRLNTIIPDCDIYLGESNNIVVDLPDGVRPSREEPVIIIVTDQNGVARKDVTVIALGNDDYIEKGKTDIYGRVTLPITDKGYTDDNGKVNVEQLNVIVNDETELIPNAYVIHNEDGTISVTLPEGKSISYDNRITVTVLDSMGNAVSGKSITISDSSEKEYTAVTDENGRIVVPPVNEDITDKDGNGVVNGHNVNISDETGKPIEKAFITIDENGKIMVELPEEVKIDIEKRIVVIVTDKDNDPEKDIFVEVTDKDGKTESNLTDENGKAIVPHTNIDYTDINGYGELDGYSVTVKNADGAIEKTYLEYDRENGKITVTLPEGKILTTSNQITVTVLDKGGKGVKDISVTVNDKNNATATKTTDTDGKITVPQIVSNGGGGGGSRSGGGGGGSISVNTTNVKITDKDGKNVTGFSKSTDKDGNVTITLPSGKTITDKDYYTITVTNGSGAAKPNITVTLKDKSNNSANGNTDKNGVVILPGEEHKAYIVGYDDGTFRPENNMTRAEAAAIFARLVSEKKGEEISGKSSFKDVSENRWFADEVGYLEKYNVISGYSDNKFKADRTITRAEFVKMAVRYYSLFNTVSYPTDTTKYTDIKGSYWAIKDISYATSVKWLNGYADGTFKGDNKITRAEVVTIVNRMLGRAADESYINKNLSVLNKFTDLKNNSHWAYYDIEEAANTHRGVNSSDGEVWSK